MKKKEVIFMPGFNGTGPKGLGPMTGYGRGYCIGYVGETAESGPGLGRGRARGWGHCDYAAGMPRWAVNAPVRHAGSPAFDPGTTGRQELEFLWQQVKNLESALEKARKRLQEKKE
ncbi:MAG: DUF5320 domain-containing protein [Peptococcaceae bacterium]|nr:DUF5320 domain-containing protein [Peptococcaceae bacterium]